MRVEPTVAAAKRTTQVRLVNGAFGLAPAATPGIQGVPSATSLVQAPQAEALAGVFAAGPFAEGTIVVHVADTSGRGLVGLVQGPGEPFAGQPAGPPAAEHAADSVAEHVAEP